MTDRGFLCGICGCVAESGRMYDRAGKSVLVCIECERFPEIWFALNSDPAVPQGREWREILRERRLSWIRKSKAEGV